MDKYKEAIQVIKSNYPPSNYTMLRDSLDLAIQALEKQMREKKEFNCKTEYYCDCGKKLDWIDFE